MDAQHVGPSSQTTEEKILSKKISNISKNMACEKKMFVPVLVMVLFH